MIKKEIIDNKLLCSKCKAWKELDNFSVTSKGRIHSRCKSCDKEYNINYLRNTYRFEKYQISLEIFNKMLVDQNYKCAICNTTLTRNCHIDHCHENKKVRGLLCPKCNKGLGLFDDSFQLLENAKNYIKQYND